MASVTRRRSFALVAVAVAAAVLAAGCARGEPDAASERSGLDPELGAPPSSLGAGGSTTPGQDPAATVPGATVPGGGGSRGTPTGGTGAAPTASSSGRCGDYKPAGSATDPQGDAGLGAPAWGDIAGLVLEDDGDRLRLTVTMQGQLPPALGERETLGVGLDLLAPGEREGRFQLFVQGDTDGWLAYLYTPAGLVDYPGTFALGGNQMVLAVPWSALSPGLDRASLFADWSKPAVAVNTGGSDRAPGSEEITLRRCAR